MHSTNNAAHTCLNCGHTFAGNYCNLCGEKVYTEHDKSIWHFFEEGLHFITHFEGKFFNTLKVLVLAPGKLSLDYCAGVRKKYFKPLSFLLLLAVVYLLIHLAMGLTMPLTTYRHEGLGAHLARIQISNKLKAGNISEEELSQKFAERSEKLSKILLVALIPLAALALWALFLTSGSPYFDHLALSTEISSGFLFYLFLVYPLMLELLVLFGVSKSTLHSPQAQPFTERYPFYLIACIYFFFTFKNFYQQHWIWTLLKTIAFAFLYEVAILQLYRFLLFEITMITI